MGRINNDAAFFMGYVQGEDRGQAALLSAALRTMWRRMRRFE